MLARAKLSDLATRNEAVVTGEASAVDEVFALLDEPVIAVPVVEPHPEA